MKCEHCGMNEATFFYRSSVNGRVTEQHLCPQCAHRLGLDRTMDMGRSFWGRDLFDSPFRMMESMLSGMGGRMLTEFPSPVEVLEPDDPQPMELDHTTPSQGLVTDAEQQAFTRECRRNALQTQLNDAIASENYEEAARLRDELRGLSA